MGSAQGRALRNGGTFYAINLASDTQEINGSTTRINWRCNVQFGDWYNWGLRLHVAVNGVEVGNWAGYCTYRGQIVINVSGSRDIGRSTGYQSVVVKAWTTSETVNGYGGVGTTTSCQYSEGINAKPSYTISYNANGGSGAPGKQTKWYGTNLTLYSTKPTRTGHNFVGWATSASGAVAYQPGSTYTGNAALTLYAKWTPHTYTVSYNANGGSGAPGNQTKTYGVNLTLSGTRPTRNLYNFKGWGISSSSTTASYQPGSTYTSNSGITLYAIWELAWLQPRITNLQATRCDSAGTLKEDGQYAKVTFNWATDRTVSAIKIVCNGVTVNGSGSGTSGSVSLVIGNNALSTESSYTVTVTVVDAVGSGTMSTTVASMYYLMDINGHGNGIAFGMPATVNNALVTNMYTWNKKGVNFTNRLKGSTGTAGGWHKLGTISSSYDSAITVIDVYSGNGYNAGTSQNTWFKLFIKDGWQQTASSTSAFACTVYMYTGPWNGFNVQIRASSHSMCDVWVQFPWAYWVGDYTVTTSARWTPAPENWQSSAPTVGVTQSVSYWSIPLMRKDGDYYGFATPEGAYAGGNDWIRTTAAGIIPYTAGGASELGTSSWPFNSIWVKELNWTGNGLKGRVMKQIWSGTLNSKGTTTVPEMPYYNLIAVRHKTDGILSIGARYVNGNNQQFHCSARAGSTNGVYAYSLNVTGTKVTHDGGPYIGWIYGIL